jgi:hypothetical protein
MLNGNMACGVHKDWLIVRVGPEKYPELLEKPNVREFDMTGRPMKGWIVVEPNGYADDRELSEWIGLGVDFARTQPAK